MSTRDTLIDLGEAAIRSFGYGGFSYADLARDAGIKKASIHHHFPAKADLGEAILGRYGERLEQSLTAISDSSATGAEALTRAIGVYRDAMGDGSTLCLCAALAGDGEKLNNAMQGRLAAANAMVIDWIDATLARGAADGSLSASAASPDAAKAALAQLQGAQMIARAGRDLKLFDAATAGMAA